MRDDMLKVITNSPRSGRSWARKSKLRYDQCEERPHVSGRRLVMEHSGSQKYPTARLEPLERYLHKQVGRLWNDIFSDICHQFNKSSMGKKYISDYLERSILRKTWYNDGGVLFCTDQWGNVEKVIDCRTELYVDADDGIVNTLRGIQIKSLIHG